MGRDLCRELTNGLELVPPGVVSVPRWRPGSDMEAKAPTMAWCGVGQKP
jgi:hypothetical protein